MVSAAEAEYGKILINVQTAVPISTNLKYIGGKQGPTDIKVDNSTAVCIATKRFCQKKSRSIYMQFYRKNNRIEQGQF